MKRIPSAVSRGTFLFLALVVVVGAFLRLYGLDSRGLATWDEGHYMMETKFVASVVEHLPRLVQGATSGDLGWVGDELEGWPISNAKPAHAVTMYLGVLLVGLDDFAGGFMNAILGTLTILLVYRVASDLAGRKAGLLGAAALAVSGIHIMYSRTSLAEVDAAFFLLLGIHLFHRSLTAGKAVSWPAMLGGLAFGYGLVSNYRWFIVAALLVLAALIWGVFAEPDTRKRVMRRASVFAIASFAPVIAFQIPYWIVGSDVLARFSSTGGLPVRSYWDALANFYMAKTTQSRFGPHLLYPRILFSMEGVLVLAAAVSGLAVCARRLRDPRILTVLVPLLAPLLLFSMTARGDRIVAISVVIPFLAIVAGIGAARLVEWVRASARPAVVGVAVFAILGLGAYRASWQLELRSGWREAVTFATRESTGRMLSFQPPIAKFYTHRDRAAMAPRDSAELEIAMASGARFLLLDWKKYQKNGYTPLIQSIETRCDPVFSVPHNVRYFPIFVDDFHYPHPGNHLSQDPNLQRVIWSDPAADSIRVYDLELFVGGGCAVEPPAGEDFPVRVPAAARSPLGRTGTHG